MDWYIGNWWIGILEIGHWVLGFGNHEVVDKHQPGARVRILAEAPGKKQTEKWRQQIVAMKKTLSAPPK